MTDRDSRRSFVTMAMLTGAGGALATLHALEGVALAGPAPGPFPSPSDVSATEDLMREHGVIRRILVVYRESAARLRSRPDSVPLEGLRRAATLMRSFGEDYHEKQLEEANIFPMMLKAGTLSAVVNTLIAQHQRGREITAYALAAASGSGTGASLGAPRAEPLASTLEAFARMYEEHAAVEDTVVFPAWKKLLSAKELDAIGDKFEDIEHRTFGKDGFEDAVTQIAAIEATMGIDLGGLTAPPPR
jgi:hemerythrin-like domain-containing protein